MKKFVIGIGLAITLATGVALAADIAHTRMMEIKNSIPVMKNIPVTAVSPFSAELRFGEEDWAIGAYNNASRRIFIAPSFWSTTKHVLIHEAGHYIWYNEMTGAERWNYCTVYNKMGKSVSRYGRTNCSENFAEMFAYANGSRHGMFNDLDTYLKNSRQLKIVKEVIQHTIQTQNK